MVSVEDLARHKTKRLNQYMMNSRETVMQAAYKRVKNKEADEGESRGDKWTGKVMHGKFIRQTEEVR